MSKTYPIFAIRDRVADSFRNLNLDVNEGVARRNFSYAVNNNPELLYQSKDLELYCIGMFDSVSGTIECAKVPILVCRGDEVINHDS